MNFGSEQGYFDIDDFLVEDQLIPVIFTKELEGMGELNGSLPETKIEAHTKLELPLFTTKFLILENFVDYEFPKCFNSKVQHALKACAQNIDLHSLGPNFFYFALKCSELIDNEEFTNFINTTFIERLVYIYDHSQSSGNSKSNVQFFNMVQTLDELELKIFNSSLEQVKEFEHWIRTTTEVGFKPKKRKFREL
ncbi:GINS complex, Psf3 component [Conidiobolus coronatus NRRL 28638]|uniref:DNA replication complex GINS protein PSF3 n=1 Tax=Conidiobolus coronatus (strain ATCC 28846 / CBS 209.66 / NRRL 28638) TaxID=796925 RepID=A0A137P4Y5_CONC2|nr:GINS complex, Psf3 component [Conidiobolus coronatus NRRL 28638]|eukprot:KXN69991.1 GINS complex, Psf3 component [Conidiobolus coronatus NRRL 28638]